MTIGRGWQRFLRAWRAVWAAMFGHDVFISYARKESRGLARKLEHELVRRGFTVFRDYSGLIGGDAYRVMLRRAAARCRLHVLILGERALASPWVKKEIRARLAYCQLKRRKRQWRPFFPVFAKSLDWSTSPAVVRGTKDFHGFPVAAADPSPASWNVGAIAREVERSFDGKRARVWWRTAGGLLLGLVVFLTSLAAWQHVSSRWRSRSIEFQAAAEAAEDRHSYAEAEMAWARAAEADFRRENLLLPRYRAAREKRSITPAFEIPVPHAGLLWLGSHGSEPVLALQDHREARILLWRPGGWSASIPTGEDSSHRFLESERGLVVLSGELLWFVPWDDSGAAASLRHGFTMGVWKTGHDTPDIRLKGGKVHLLGWVDDDSWLLEVAPEAWSVPRRVRLEPMPSAGAMRIAESESWAAVGAQVVPLSKVPFPVVELVAWKTTGERVTLRAAARQPDVAGGRDVRVSEILPSRDDQQMFLRIEESMPALPGLGQSFAGAWVAVDVDPRREAMAIGAETARLLPLHAWDDSEAVLDDGDGEISLLTWKGPPLLARPERVVMADVTSWALLDAGKGMREPAVLALFHDNRIKVMRSFDEVFASAPGEWAAASQSIRLHASPDGSWLAVEARPDRQPEAAWLEIHRVARPAAVDEMPAPGSLEREFTPARIRIPEIE